MIVKIVDDGVHYIECESANMEPVIVYYQNMATIDISNGHTNGKMFTAREYTSPDLGQAPIHCIGEWLMEDKCRAHLYTVNKRDRDEMYLVHEAVPVYIMENGKTVDRL